MGASLGVLIYRVLELTFIVPTPVVGFSPELLGLVVDGKRVRMFAYTLSTSLLLVLALACCFAPAAAKGHAPGVGSSQVWAVVGCVCFIVSDTLLTYTRHVQPFPFSEGIFLGFYVLGQTALTMSVPAWGRSTKQDEGGVEGEETKEERTQNASKKME